MIWLYRRPLLYTWCDGEDTLAAVVTHVLVHEIGHHFGFTDADLETSFTIALIYLPRGRPGARGRSGNRRISEPSQGRHVSCRRLMRGLEPLWL